MRTLVITRGLPGSGKSTFLRELGWAPYTLEPDALRLMYRGPEMQPDGAMSISAKADSAVWKLLYSLLEERMAEGAFSVVDATHLYPQSLSAYRRLAKRYRYSLYVLDFTGVPEPELLRRNAQRGLRRVPEDALLRMARRLRAVSLPGWVQSLQPADARTLLRRPLELGSYRRVLHVGDIHGCYTALRLLLPEPQPMADTFYIFHGDLVDRGTENAEVAEFLAAWALFPNVVVLEGNHEASLRAFAGMEGPAPAEYELYTRREWEGKGLAPETAGALYRRTWQCCSYTYRGRKVFACHGGVPNTAGNPLYINTRQLVMGVGGYGQAARIAREWDAAMPPDCFQVHGHRNRECLPVQASQRVFNLEGQVEFGGCLRAVELTEQGFRPVEIPNPVPAVAEMRRFTPWLFTQNGGAEPPAPEPPREPASATEAPEAVRRLRADPELRESSCGVVSAFCPRRRYTDEPAHDADTLACALFVNTVSGETVVRGYDELAWLQHAEKELRYPLTVCVQENGFLGLAGYDRQQGRLVLATRRSLEGPRISLFRKVLRMHVDMEELTSYLKESRTTLAFEVVGCWEDPHIVPYDRMEVILMDEIHNTPEFRCSPYSRLSRLAQMGRTVGGLRIKRKTGGRIRNREELNTFLLLHQNDEVEGFVFEDAAGRRAYSKTVYYQRWCWIREELRKWRKGLPERETIPTCYPFLLWAHDYLLSHPDERSRGINFYTLRALYQKMASSQGGL